MHVFWLIDWCISREITFPAQIGFFLSRLTKFRWHLLIPIGSGNKIKCINTIDICRQYWLWKFIISMDLEWFRIINCCCRYQPWNTQQKQQVFNVPGIKIDVRNVVVIMHSSFIFNVPPAMQLSCCLTSLRSQRQEILSKQSFWDFIFFLGCKRSSRFHSSKCLNIFTAK